jgi:hypothetical protein
MPPTPRCVVGSGCNGFELRAHCSGVMTRRYEVLLPSRFNDGHEVVETCMRCLPDTLMEVVDQFGALSFEPRTPRASGPRWAGGTTTSCSV